MTKDEQELKLILNKCLVSWPDLVFKTLFLSSFSWVKKSKKWIPKTDAEKKSFLVFRNL